MKREIYCPKCAKQSFLKPPFEPGEEVKMVQGNALRYCLCDFCGSTICPGNPTVAVSIYLVGRYFPWEDEFILVDREGA